MIQQSHSWAYVQTKLYSKRYIHCYVHTALLTIAKAWKQLKCPSTDEWIKKVQYIYTVEYYLDKKAS